MEILIVLFIIGSILFFIKTSQKISKGKINKYKNQGEDTWDKWIEEDKKKKELEENDMKYKKWKEVTETKFEKKTVPDGYYQSAEYIKFCAERTKKYNELLSEGKIVGQVKDAGGRNPFPEEEEVFPCVKETEIKLPDGRALHLRKAI